MFSVHAQGTRKLPRTYYVDQTAGNDSNTGLKQDAAFKTISKINELTFLPNDRILFKRGETWRETLTVPSSGASGRAITFGAYGSGAKPIFSGANIAGTWTSDAITEDSGGVWHSGFEGEADAMTTEWDSKTTTSANTFLLETSTVVHGAKAGRATFDGTGTDAYVTKTFTAQTDAYFRVYFYLEAGLLEATDYKGLTIASLAATGGWDVLRMKVEYLSGNYQAYFGSPAFGGDLYEGTAISAGAWHYFEVHWVKSATVGGFVIYIDGEQKASVLNRDTSAVSVDTIYVGAKTGGYTNMPQAGKHLYVDDVKIDSSYIGGLGSGLANVWNAPVTVDPGIRVWFNGTLGTLVGSKAACDGVGKWYWASNVLSVYSTSSPATTFTSPGIETAIRNPIINKTAIDYITIDSLHLDKSASYALWSNPEVRGTGLTISNVDVTLSGSDALIPIQSGMNTISNTHIIGSLGYGFKFEGTATYNITDSSSDGSYNAGFVAFDTTTVNCSRCIAKNTGVGGGTAGQRNGFGASSDGTMNLNYCLSYGNTDCGYACSTSTGGTIYNSVFYNNNLSHDLYRAGFVSVSGAFIIKNSIFQDNYTYEVRLEGGTITSDYNDFYHAAGGNFMYYPSSATTFSGWKTASSQDANSLSSNPLFISASDFHLQAGSPAINAGVNVGPTTDYEGNTVGDPPEIGAYEHLYNIYYVDQTAGNDSNNGVTTSTAFKTISKINGLTFNPGDYILFKRGETWREQLTVPSSGAIGRVITFGAYGTGAKPIINASDVVAGFSLLDGGTGNVWQSAVTTEPSVVWFNGVAGTKQTSIANLSNSGDWHWASNVLSVKSTTDPSGTVESASRASSVLVNTGNITLSNLSIVNGGNGGATVQFGSGSSNGTVDSCDFSNSGIEHIGIWGSSTGNYLISNSTFAYSGLSHVIGAGNAIDVTTTTTPLVIVEKSTFTHIGDWTGSQYHDHGIYFKSGRLIWRYNVVSNGGEETGAGVKISTDAQNGCEVYYNIFSKGDGTQEWGVMSEAPSSGHLIYNNVFYGVGTAIWAYTGSGGMTIKNNIFHDAGTSTQILRANVTTGWTSDYNVIYNSGGISTSLLWGETSYNFADWKINSSQDTHSISSDPLFVSTTDFHLQAGSPAIGAGVNVGLTTDYEGKAVGDPPEIGAYEYP